MPNLGAHVSTAGGLYKCFQNAEAIGAQGIQIFGASPRQWNAKMPEEKILEKYHEEQKRSKLGPVFLHASYLVNLGTPDPELYEKSIQNLAAHLQIAELLKAEGLIYHIGSYKGSTAEESYKRVAEGMLTVLKQVPGKAKLIMENSAGGGNKIGLTAAEIGAVYKQSSKSEEGRTRIKVCIDTAHIFAAGVLEKFSPEELKRFKDDCEKSFGLKNIIVLHVNDSKVPYDCQKDRHENLGEGEIGLEAFKHLARDEFFGNIPWLLEVPGFDNQGPDKANMEIAKGLFKSL